MNLFCCLGMTIYHEVFKFYLKYIYVFYHNKLPYLLNVNFGVIAWDED